MTRLTILCKMAVLLTGIASVQAAEPPHDDADSACLLQLSVEDSPTDTSSDAEASAGSKPVEEIASGELGAMENIMGKELDVMGKELGVMEKSMGDIVEMKKLELGVVKREQGMTPVPPLTSAAQEKAQGATTNGTRMEGHVLDRHVLGDGGSSDPSDWATSPVAVLNVEAADPALEGFWGGFTDGTYGYCVPLQNMNGGYGKVARFDLAGFATIETLDLQAADPRLKLFSGGFADGTYGYTIPYYTGTQWPGHSNKVARFDLASFATTETLNLGDADPRLLGFEGGGFTDGTYGYAIPARNGAVARFDLAGFATVETLDLATTDPALTIFMGGFTDGTYGYAIPHRDDHSKVARFDLAGFVATEALDLLAAAPDLKNFYGGFTDGIYGYAIPFYFHGKMVRFDLAGFATVEVLDLAANDNRLRAFHYGITDGTYGYAIPHQYHKVARFDLAGFATVEVLDFVGTNAYYAKFVGGFTDGTYGYAVAFSSRNRAYNSAKVAQFGVLNYNSGQVARFEVVKHVRNFALDKVVQGDQSGGQGDQSSVVGDPHVVNVAHARFEIRAAGVHKLVQIPQLIIQASGKPDLRVDAKIEHLVSNDCSKSFMTSLTIFGGWTEDAFGLVRISQGSDAPNTTLLINTQPPEEFFKQFPTPGAKAGGASLTFKLKDVSFHVGKHFEGRYGKQKAYLNVRIAGLKKYKDLGGLLGYDDHADAEKRDVNCAAANPPAAYQSSFIGNERSAPTTSDGGSRIEAE